MKRLLTTLLACVLLLSLAAPVMAASTCVEAESAAELAELLAPRASVLSLRPEQTVRLLVLAERLPDFCGAKRALHYADYSEYILEFSDLDSARAARQTLTEEYGLTKVWLDEGLACVSDEVIEPADEPEETEKPKASEKPEATAAPTEKPVKETEAPETTEPPETMPEPAGYTPRSWGAGAMGLDLFRNSTAVQKHTAGRKVVVAVLDTGADLTVDVLKKRGISKNSFDFVNSTKKITDVTRGASAGHGTRVATLLDDLLPENAEIMVLRVFDETGATQTTVRLALQYALEMGADVINMSMGWDQGEHYSFLDDVLVRAYGDGVPVICAAGNSSQSAATEYPANNGTTIAVSAVNRSLNYDQRSNYGDKIDFTAPGAELTLIAPGNQVVTGRGTSFAAPHIAAAAAAVLLSDPNLSVPQLYDALKANATDLGDQGKDWLYGWGLPQLASYTSTAISHLWDAGVIEVLATRTKDGLRLYTCGVCNEARPETVAATAGSTRSGFDDVARSSYYAESVTWAVANGITTGTTETTFDPAGFCTRAQMVTFLWRTAGSPEPERTKSPFTDVKDKDQYYYKAVLWAVEQGITTGMTDTTFEPDTTVTRGQTVTFLWRMDGEPASGAKNPFADVSSDAYYYSPVLWAVEHGITTGMTETSFEPAGFCTRGQIVTFLYRYLGDR